MAPGTETTLDLGTLSTGEPLALPLGLLDTHCQILAPTGYGKSRLLARMAQELVAKTPHATVVLDPAGDLVNHLRRWAHEHNHQQRLVVIDPRDRRLVCGLNPMRPWSTGPALQAGVIRDIIRRALGGNESSTSAPLAAQWIYNVVYALIECRLTMREVGPLLSYSNPEFRNAVVQQLPRSNVREEFEWLASVLNGTSNTQAMRLANEQLGSTTRRLRQFATNDHLLAMLEGQENVIDWDWAIDSGKLVLVNLSLEANALTDEDQRLLGQLIVSSIIRRVFARAEGRRRPVHLLIDEAGKLASPEVTTVLNEGRKYRLRLVLAHQVLSQLINHADGDRTLHDAVINNARLKIVFGGLGPQDAAVMGETLFGHLGDPDKRKLELRSLMQLSHVEERESVTEGESWTTSRQRVRVTSEMHGTSSAHAHGYASGRTSSVGVGHGAGVALSQPIDLDANGEGFYVHSDLDSASATEGDSEGASDVDVESESHAYGVARGVGITRGRGESRSTTRGPMVVPGEPFEVLTSVQFESLDEQLHRHVSRMIRQPDRHAVVASGKAEPVHLTVANVPEPKLTMEQARLLDLQVMEHLPCYASPEAIEREAVAREQRFLRSAEVEIVDSQRAIERRRATRRAVPPTGPDEGDGALPAPVPLVPKPPRRSSRAAAAPLTFPESA